jgi:hypothetical protein
MLHQHKGHAGVGWHVIEETPERGKPACGSSDPHHQRRRTAAAAVCRLLRSFFVQTLVSHAGNPFFIGSNRL